MCSSAIRWNILLASTLLLLFNSTFAFVIQNDYRKFSSRSMTRLVARASDQNEQGDDSSLNADNDREQSQMPDYINAFLQKSREEEDYEEGSANEALNEHDRFTHMIGIPMEQCHDLMIQLESVQRAVIYNCPALVNSCIVPVMTRLPMLYVEAPSSAITTATGDLQAIIRRVVKKHIFVKQEQKEDAPKSDDDDEILLGPNKNGHLPLLLTFEKLEVDGENEVLYTTCKETEQSSILVDVLNEIRNELQSLGYKTRLPPNDNLSGDEWKPRVPFMRLPDNFEETLPPLQDGVKEFMRDPEQGGNGISPILWCKWWDDVFSENIRMREIGVYARQPAEKGLGESAFYFPHETVTLPKGNEALTAAENRDRQYQDARMADAEKVVETATDEIPDATVEKARELFESLYEDDAVENEQEKNSVDDIIKEKEVNYSGNDESSSAAIEEDVQTLDEPSKEKIRKTVEGLESVRARNAITTPKKDLPPLDENPIFQQYRTNRDEIAKTPISFRKPKEDLPPYPSREYFVGPWRLVSSPIPSEEILNPDDKETSDNLILRVDGTTFGGPVLDRENMHKAAGGTWKNFQARWVGGDEESPKTVEQTRMRVRLVVPPEKKRILVLEGEVKRLMMPSDLQETRSSFGIPLVDKANESTEMQYDNLLQCEGEMWVEDANSGENRNKLGRFLLMKIEGNSDPGDYVITIPRGVRTQD